MNENNICFVDFETTGIDIFRDQPIELGVVLVDANLEVIKSYSSKIRIEKKTYLTKSAFKIHNINMNELTDAPTGKEVLSEFFDRFGTNFRFGGWNINFDVSFFRKLCHSNGFMVKYNKINHRHIDIQSLNFLADVLNLYQHKVNSLSDVVAHFGLKRAEKHTALEDSLLTAEVYKNLIELFKKRTN